MWFWLALASAVFAALTSIFAKVGIQGVDSHLATALRTAVVLAFAWLMVFVAGSWRELGALEGRTWLFLILSGLATGLSWMCYFHALQIGEAIDEIGIVSFQADLPVQLQTALAGALALDHGLFYPAGQIIPNPQLTFVPSAGYH